MSGLGLSHEESEVRDDAESLRCSRKVGLEGSERDVMRDLRSVISTFPSFAFMVRI